jgi:hypothetical protein
MNQHTRRASWYIALALAGACFVLVALNPDLVGAMLFLPLMGSRYVLE